MRAQEFLIEYAVGTLKINDIVYVVDNHAFDRVRDREVQPAAIDYLLKKMHLVREVLDSIDLGQKIWVYDSTQDIAIGLRRKSGDQLTFQLKTVVGKKPYDGPTPIITIR